MNLLIGGEERYDMLKNFFNEICDIPNLQILVITANPSAQKSNVNYRNFFEMVKLSIPCLTEERFLCSSSSSKSIEFNNYCRSIHDDSIKHDDSMKRKGSFNEGNGKKSRKNGGRKNRTKRTKRRHK